MSVGRNHLTSASLHSSGFSLLELLITTAIIGVLSTIGIGMYNDYQVKVTELKVKRNFDVVAEAIDKAFHECSIHGKDHLAFIGERLSVRCNAPNSFGGAKYLLQIPIGNYFMEKLGSNPYDDSYPAVRNSGRSPPVGTIHVDYGRASNQCDGSGRWCVRIFYRGKFSRETRIFFLPNWCNGDSDDALSCK